MLMVEIYFRIGIQLKKGAQLIWHIHMFGFVRNASGNVATQ